MKSRSMVWLKPWNILIILGVTVSPLTLTSSRMVSASVVSGSNASNSDQGVAKHCSPIDPRCDGENPNSSRSSSDASNSNEEAIGHINEAQSALQNGDTEGAQGHLDLARQVLGCSKIIDPNC